jgi:hypothetical protein
MVSASLIINEFVYHLDTYSENYVILVADIFSFLGLAAHMFLFLVFAAHERIYLTNA